MRKQAAAFNRRMRKTARPVVWEGAEAQSSAPDPIAITATIPIQLKRLVHFSAFDGFDVMDCDGQSA